LKKRGNLNQAALNRDGKTGYVYFITATYERNYPVKIGFTETEKGIYARLASLQTGNPNKLKVIRFEKACYGHEQYLHEKYGYLRLEGEWFKRNKQLIEYINTETEGAWTCGPFWRAA
jgi:hypothetical protein